MAGGPRRSKNVRLKIDVMESVLLTLQLVELF